MLSTNREIVFRVRVVRDVSCVRNCGREFASIVGLCSGSVLLLRLLLRSFVPLVSRSFCIFLHFLHVSCFSCYSYLHFFRLFILHIFSFCSFFSFCFHVLLFPSAFFHFSTAMRFRVPAVGSGSPNLLARHLAGLKGVVPPP